MAFKAKSKELKSKQKRDCKNFKLEYWYKECCIFSNRCANAETDDKYIMDTCNNHPNGCTGITWKSRRNIIYPSKIIES